MGYQRQAMKHRIKAASLLLIVFAVAAFGLTTLTSMIIKNSQITNSTINSTQIGNTSPSTASFQSQMAANTAVAPNQQGAYLGWGQAGLGESDFIDQRGTGSGGWYWYGANSSNQITAMPMSLDFAGNLSTASSVHSPNLFGTLTGNVNGNALSANALANSPSQCTMGVGQYIVGIQANGNANCYSAPPSLGSPGYFSIPNSGIVIEFGRSNIPTGNGDFIALPHPFNGGQILAVVASDAGSESNPTQSYVRKASAVVNSASNSVGFYAYLKDDNNNYVGGPIGWIAICAGS